MGKREISKLSPFDLVVAILIAELAVIPIDKEKINLIKGITPIVLLVFLEILISFVSLKSKSLRQFINGKPVVLVREGEIDFKALKKIRYTVSNLLLQLRKKNVFNLHEIKLAFLETTGELTVITNQIQDKINLPVIVDGKINEINLDIIGVDEFFIKNMLKKRELEISQIILAMLSEEKKLKIIKLKEDD